MEDGESKGWSSTDDLEDKRRNFEELREREIEFGG